MHCPHCNPNLSSGLFCPLRLNETILTTHICQKRQEELKAQDQKMFFTVKSQTRGNMRRNLVKRSKNLTSATTTTNLPTSTKHQSIRYHIPITGNPPVDHYLVLVCLGLVFLLSRLVESVPAYMADQAPMFAFANPSYPNPLSASPPVIPTSSICPLVTVCQCKWSNNKQGASCERRNLNNIPSQLPPDTQVLDMNGNNLIQLGPHIFQDKHLNNLQKIFLSECKISFIAGDAFSHLTNLVELDLSHNNLQQVPVKSFEQLNQLRKLSLAHNPISVIEADSFTLLSHLTNLDLSNCQIGQLKPNALSGLAQLKELKLHDNRLTQLPMNIVEVFPDYLLLDLYSNPWHCDCELRQSIDYMSRHHVQQSIQPSCATPQRHKDIRWPNVRSDEFLCPPVVINKQNELVVGAGSNVSLACTARGSPPLTFVWFQDEKNMTSSRPNNITDGGPSSTKLLEERRYEIAEELGPLSQPNVTTSVLYLYNLELSDTSTFFCWVENAAGYTMANYSITVNDSPPAQLAGVSVLNGGIWRSLGFNQGEAQIGFLSMAFVLLLAAAIIFLLMFKNSSRSSKSSQSSDIKHSKHHQNNMPPIGSISSSNKFSPTSNHRSSVTDSDEEGEEDEETDRSSSGSGNSYRHKNTKVSDASDLHGFMECIRSGIINQDYHSMSPIIHFNNNTMKSQQSQQHNTDQQQQNMISQQHFRHQQQAPYLDSNGQVNPQHLHQHLHHFQSASSVPYYGQNNVNGSASMATTTSDLSPASSSGSNVNFVQPAPLTNCDLQQHQLSDPSMTAPATNTTTTSYTSDYQSGYSEDPSVSSHIMPPMYYDTLEAGFHPASHMYNNPLMIGQATTTLLRHPQQQQQQQQQQHMQQQQANQNLLLQDMVRNGRPIANGPNGLWIVRPEDDEL